MLEKISRKISPNENEETGNEKVVVSEEDVPEVRLPLPIYDDMGFPDHGLDRF